jgi:ATP-dependent Lhr-like helicase
LPAEVEDALWELVSAGLVTGDGVAGLRRLLKMGERRVRPQTRLRAVSTRPRPLAEGRWSLWRTGIEPAGASERVEAFARQLLRRYGVVFREVLARERHAPSWRAVLAVYRTWEMRQEVRGGRFVSGFVGEQFALPEAVEALRAVRRAPPDADTVIVSAADPLNLVGILLPGPRAGALSGLSIAYRDGVALEVAPLGTLRERLHAEAR